MAPETGFARHALARLFRSRRLRTLDELAEFARTEALRVAQASLLGHLRARMGTSWPAHFTDPAFVPVIQRAQVEGFRICLADLVVCLVACAGGGAAAARLVFARAARDDAGAIEARLADPGWQNPDTAFRTSLRGLIAVLPVAERFRDEDREPFANALALRWAEVRRKFAARADIDALGHALAAPPSGDGDR